AFGDIADLNQREAVHERVLRVFRSELARACEERYGRRCAARAYVEQPERVMRVARFGIFLERLVEHALTEIVASQRAIDVREIDHRAEEARRQLAGMQQRVARRLEIAAPRV